MEHAECIYGGGTRVLFVVEDHGEEGVLRWTIDGRRDSGWRLSMAALHMWTRDKHKGNCVHYCTRTLDTRKKEKEENMLNDIIIKYEMFWLLSHVFAFRLAKLLHVMFEDKNMHLSHYLFIYLFLLLYPERIKGCLIYCLGRHNVPNFSVWFSAQGDTISLNLVVARIEKLILKLSQES